MTGALVMTGALTGAWAMTGALPAIEEGTTKGATSSEEEESIAKKANWNAVNEAMGFTAEWTGAAAAIIILGPSIASRGVVRAV